MEGRREALGRAIQALRAERGMKRRDLARAAGVSYPYLSEIENGKKDPSSTVLTQIAAALELRPSGLWRRVDDLLAEIEGPAPAPMAAASERASWFRGRPSARDEPPMHALMEKPDRRALDELLLLAERLSPDDLEALVDLARRLARR